MFLPLSLFLGERPFSFGPIRIYSEKTTILKTINRLTTTTSPGGVRELTANLKKSPSVEK